MGRLYSYLNSAVHILNQYRGEEPFASFLKKFFARHKKYGSNDRKQIGHLCYCFFRLGKSLMQIPVEERILIALFLCSTEPNEMIQQLKPEWTDNINQPLDKKLLIINNSLFISDIFPWEGELSDGIDQKKFCESFLIQPDLFLRVRPGYDHNVKEKLLNAGIEFREMNSSCLSMPNNSKIENIIELDKEAVVQDYNSQNVGDFFKMAIGHLQSPIHAWDCCAASGGKSLLLYDLAPTVDLTVTDIRESIISNLKKRFAKARIKKYQSFIADLTLDSRLQTPDSRLPPPDSRLPTPDSHLPPPDYDLIICDAPCTGSGTWGRTPEQLYFFEERRIEQYATLQKKIISNIISHLKENGFLVYITCSVFKKENEEIVNTITGHFQLQLIEMTVLKGYERKADTMFVSLFRKSL